MSLWPASNFHSASETAARGGATSGRGLAGLPMGWLTVVFLSQSGASGGEIDREGERGLRALAGGGRYNNLVKKLGYADLPAVGFAIGDVTTGLLLEQRGLTPQFINAPEIYVIIGGEAERRVALADIQALRAAGFRVEYPFKELAFGKQFKVAAECGAKLALIYGGDEIAKGVVKIRSMVDRTEHDVPREQLRAAVRDYLSGH